MKRRRPTISFWLRLALVLTALGYFLSLPDDPERPSSTAGTLVAALIFGGVLWAFVTGLFLLIERPARAIARLGPRWRGPVWALWGGGVLAFAALVLAAKIPLLTALQLFFGAMIAAYLLPSFSGPWLERRRVWGFVRRLNLPHKLELPTFAYAPLRPAPLSAAPRLEVTLENGQVWVENKDASSVLVKGLGSSGVNGWWTPLEKGQRKRVLRQRERAEADMWVREHDTVRVRVWCCRLDNPQEEFVLERELGEGARAESRTLN